MRLSYEIPLLNTWAQAINLGLNPTNLPSTVDRISETVSIISSLDNPNKTKKFLILKIDTNDSILKFRLKI